MPYPNTLFSMNGSRTLEVMGSLDTFQFPLVVKSITGFKGKDNYLVASESELMSAVIRVSVAELVATACRALMVCYLGFGPYLSNI